MIVTLPCSGSWLMPYRDRLPVLCVARHDWRGRLLLQRRSYLLLAMLPAHVHMGRPALALGLSPMPRLRFKLGSACGAVGHAMRTLGYGLGSRLEAHRCTTRPNPVLLIGLR